MQASVHGRSHVEGNAKHSTNSCRIDEVSQETGKDGRKEVVLFGSQALSGHNVKALKRKSTITSLDSARYCLTGSSLLSSTCWFPGSLSVSLWVDGLLPSALGEMNAADFQSQRFHSRGDAGTAALLQLQRLRQLNKQAFESELVFLACAAASRRRR